MGQVVPKDDLEISMRARLLQATIIAIGLIIAGFLAGGRYVIVNSSTNAITRLDRFTGAVSMCVPGAAADGCGFVLDKQSTGRSSN
jgi:hypothetical protein